MTSKLEERVNQQLRIMGIDFQPEYRFHPTRRWRFDFAIPYAMIAIEVEGGSWVNGAHVRGKHFQSDCEKYNAAQKLGWKVYRLTGEMVDRGELFELIENHDEMEGE